MGCEFHANFALCKTRFGEKSTLSTLCKKGDLTRSVIIPIAFLCCAEWNIY